MIKTVEELEQIDRAYLLADDIAGVLRLTPHYIRYFAKREPEKLGFPVIVVGSRVRIPKAAFLHFMKYGTLPA